MNFYSFPNEQAYIDVITTEVENEDGGMDSIQTPPENVDIIGSISKRTGGTDEEPIFTTMDGFHVNTLDPVEGWEAFEVHPATPHRVFAGV